jgi:hypothetical protein
MWLCGCCSHSTTLPFSREEIKAKLNVCYIGDTFILLHKDNIANNGLEFGVGDHEVSNSKKDDHSNENHNNQDNHKDTQHNNDDNKREDNLSNANDADHINKKQDNHEDTHNNEDNKKEDNHSDANNTDHINNSNNNNNLNDDDNNNMNKNININNNIEDNTKKNHDDIHDHCDPTHHDNHNKATSNSNGNSTDEDNKTFFGKISDHNEQGKWKAVRCASCKYYVGLMEKEGVGKDPYNLKFYKHRISTCDKENALR